MPHWSSKLPTQATPTTAIANGLTYAVARVPIYWIVDLGRRRLEIHSEPAGQGETAYYGLTQILGQDDEVALVLDGREIARFAVREILP